jgi:hypothetical protein
MNVINKEFPEDLGDAFKDLPLKMRVKVDTTVNRLLEIQKENSAFLTEAEDMALEDERGDGE